MLRKSAHLDAQLMAAALGTAQYDYELSPLINKRFCMYVSRHWQAKVESLAYHRHPRMTESIERGPVGPQPLAYLHFDYC